MSLFTLDALTLDTTGELRFNGALPPAEIVLDEDGAVLGQGFVVDDRLRARLQLGDAGTWHVATEWDLFSGQLAGDTWDIPGTLDARHREDLGVLDAGSFVPRQAYAQALVGAVQIQAGLVTSHWGLGMLANDGAHDALFGRTDFGDRLLRVRVATRPFGPDRPLTVAFAADRVVADDSATMADAQAAWQGVAAALWADQDVTGGVYLVVRDQLEADGERRSQVGVLDLTGSVSRPVANGLDLVVQGEVAGITGRSSRSRTYTSPEGLDVASAGAMGRLGLEAPLWNASVYGGWASGDGNPDDGVSHDFSFDRDANVGMVLFDELGGAIEAQTWNHLTDLEHTGQAPDGVDATVTEGAFRRATYVQPVLGVGVSPIVDLHVGWLSAWSTAPIANPYTSFRNGGTPTNHLGEATSGRAIGTELDASLTLTAPESWAARPGLRVQGAWYRASADMGGASGVYVLATGRVRW